MRQLCAGGKPPCRSTSAVSALKKLEQQCDAELVVKQGRHLALTRNGEILMGYARRLLALNDEAQRALKGELLQGRSALVCRRFWRIADARHSGRVQRHHPGLRIIARVDRNPALLTALDDNAGYGTFVESKRPREGKSACQLSRWIQHPETDNAAGQGEPLPLVMFENPCLMRSRATACLDRAGIAWRVVFVSHSLSGIWAAVQAGLGITLRTRCCRVIFA
jgi:DNA-binding transcriptional LysR family regulator